MSIEDKIKKGKGKRLAGTLTDDGEFVVEKICYLVQLVAFPGLDSQDLHLICTASQVLAIEIYQCFLTNGICCRHRTDIVQL